MSNPHIIEELLRGAIEKANSLESRVLQLEALLEIAQRRANDAEETIRNIEAITQNNDWPESRLVDIDVALDRHRTRNT